MKSEEEITDCAKKTRQAYTSWAHTITGPRGEDSSSFGHFTRLNFILAKGLLKEIQKSKKTKKRKYAFFFLFKSDLQGKRCKNFIRAIQRAERCCMNQDLHLMRYRQFFLREGLFSKKIMDWKFFRQVVRKKQIAQHYIKIRHSPSITFKRHLIKKIELNGKGDGGSVEDREQEALHYQSRPEKVYGAEFGGGSSPISVH